MKRMLFLLLLIPSVSALQLQDNLYFSLEPNSSTCITVQLPDDSGSAITGKQDFLLTTTASGWADLTRQTIRTDENSTVLIPICFSSSGHNLGECSDPYTIQLALGNSNITWNGGVCVAETMDVDTSTTTPTTPNGIADILNSNVDIFDTAFQFPQRSASPGEELNATLLIQSFASRSYTITVNGFAQATAEAATSPAFPTARTNITLTAPAIPGTYTTTATVTAQNCTGPFCTKTASFRVVVGGNMRGYDLSLFPTNLNVKTLDPVPYDLSIINYDIRRTIVFDAQFPAGLDHTFFGSARSLAPGESTHIRFTVTPQNHEAFYELIISGSSGTLSKQAHAYLSTDELLTDAKRLAGDDPTLDTFIDQYPSSNDLAAYAALKAKIEHQSNTSMQPPTNTTTQPPAQPPLPAAATKQADYTPLLLGGAAALVIILLVLFFRRREPDLQNWN